MPPVDRPLVAVKVGFELHLGLWERAREREREIQIGWFIKQKIMISQTWTDW